MLLFMTKINEGKKEGKLIEFHGSMPWRRHVENTRSTIWQLANQKRRVAMALLQKKGMARGRRMAI
jgi:hypothetical protein